jgi:hypothetical protein
METRAVLTGMEDTSDGLLCGAGVGIIERTEVEHMIEYKGYTASFTIDFEENLFKEDHWQYDTCQ